MNHNHDELTAEQREAVKMLFDAHRELDQLRIRAAMKHLEFLDTMARFSPIEHGTERTV